MKLFFIISILFVSSIVEAKIYKCKKDGKTVYKESPCEEDERNPLSVIALFNFALLNLLKMISMRSSMHNISRLLSLLPDHRVF